MSAVRGAGSGPLRTLGRMLRGALMLTGVAAIGVPGWFLATGSARSLRLVRGKPRPPASFATGPSLVRHGPR